MLGEEIEGSHKGERIKKRSVRASKAGASQATPFFHIPGKSGKMAHKYVSRE